MLPTWTLSVCRHGSHTFLSLPGPEDGTCFLWSDPECSSRTAKVFSYAFFLSWSNIFLPTMQHRGLTNIIFHHDLLFLPWSWFFQFQDQDVIFVLHQVFNQQNLFCLDWSSRMFFVCFRPVCHVVWGANKCVFCWRHHKNPVGTEWKWSMDPPDQPLGNNNSMVNITIQIGIISFIINYIYMLYYIIYTVYTVNDFKCGSCLISIDIHDVFCSPICLTGHQSIPQHDRWRTRHALGSWQMALISTKSRSALDAPGGEMDSTKPGWSASAKAKLAVLNVKKNDSGQVWYTIFCVFTGCQNIYIVFICFHLITTYFLLNDVSCTYYIVLQECQQHTLHINWKRCQTNTVQNCKLCRYLFVTVRVCRVNEILTRHSWCQERTLRWSFEREAASMKIKDGWNEFLNGFSVHRRLSGFGWFDFQILVEKKMKPSKIVYFHSLFRLSWMVFTECSICGTVKSLLCRAICCQALCLISGGWANHVPRNLHWWLPSWSPEGCGRSSIKWK